VLCDPSPCPGQMEEAKKPRTALVALVGMPERKNVIVVKLSAWAHVTSGIDAIAQNFGAPDFLVNETTTLGKWRALKVSPIKHWLSGNAALFLCSGIERCLVVQGV
jgi:hypothetical protein